MALRGDHPSVSHDTALCFIPPRDRWHTIDSLRYSNDKAYGKWPPHVNVVYPFVHPSCLQATVGRILSVFENDQDLFAHSSISLSLDSPGSFPQKQGGTFFIHDEDQTRLQRLHGLRANILKTLHWNNRGDYRMHMTVAQCEEAPDSDKHQFMLEKVKLLPPVTWEAHQLAVLVRDEMTGHMRVYGHIDLTSRSFESYQRPLSMYSTPPSEVASAEPRCSYRFDGEESRWSLKPIQPDALMSIPEHIVIASYNVLAEFQWPPNSARYPLVIRNLLAVTAQADAIVLQEVSDDFLHHLLDDEDVRRIYPYATHASPDRLDIGPLPSMLNVVVLSRHSFTWSYLPFQRRHKGCCIVTFDHIGRIDKDGHTLPLVLAATHLSQGLNDGAVAAKRGELQRILNYMLASHPNNIWVVAGDFNMVTSSYTLGAALKTGAISKQTRASLEQMEAMLREAGLVDAWVAARIEAGESSDDIKQTKSLGDIFEGEQGATFDPGENPIAAGMVGTGLNNRPQRYDRILLKGAHTVAVSGFNMFGFLTDPAGPDQVPRHVLHASDHWGVRCLLRSSLCEPSTPTADSVVQVAIVPVSPLRAPPSLSDTDMLKKCLYNRHCLPTTEEERFRSEAFELLRAVVLEDAGSDESDMVSGRFPSVLVPVGSYGLGVWTQESDLDCFCIGSCSPSTFFRLARQRIVRAASRGIRVLRKVQSKSGTMLILEVRGVKADLQYCQAPHIAEAWPDIMKRPPSDPAFNLKFESLLKLKPARDLLYLRRSIPDLAQFRISYQLIKEWAQTRGIYGAKFGLLGGVHLSVLLVRVCKMLSHGGTIVSAADIIVTFFDHYAGFDWQTQVVFDPFFHKRFRYNRTHREALCLVGWHSPVLNTGMAASKPTVKTLANEFQRAQELLLMPDITWAEFLGENKLSESGLSAGARDFLVMYRSYIKMDLRYWGSSLEKGCKFVGWLESRCVSLLVDLGLKLPGLLARIWPHRFTESQTEEMSTSGHYQGAYLIGLDWDADIGGPTSRDDLKSAHETLQTVLQQFERRIHGDEVYFDPHRSWFDASLVRASELGSMSLDDQDWGQYQSDDDESDEEVDEVMDAAPAVYMQRARRPKGSVTSTSPATLPSKPEGAPRLRTAADVLHRLRWDPGMRSDDFVIGYTDRHLNEPQEKAVDAWKAEQTHEEFIPQHRILYFKRKSDGVLVWERSTRTDHIFGAGQNTVQDSQGSASRQGFDMQAN